MENRMHIRNKTISATTNGSVRIIYAKQKLNNDNIDLEIAYEKTDINLPYEARKEKLKKLMEERFSSCIRENADKISEGILVVANGMFDRKDNNICNIKTDCTDDFRRIMDDIAKDLSKESVYEAKNTKFFECAKIFTSRK